jgi:hypothetical protein
MAQFGDSLMQAVEIHGLGTRERLAKREADDLHLKSVSDMIWQDALHQHAKDMFQPELEQAQADIFGTKARTKATEAGTAATVQGTVQAAALFPLEKKKAELTNTSLGQQIDQRGRAFPLEQLGLLTQTAHPYLQAGFTGEGLRATSPLLSPVASGLEATNLGIAQAAAPPVAPVFGPPAPGEAPPAPALTAEQVAGKTMAPATAATIEKAHEAVANQESMIAERAAKAADRAKRTELMGKRYADLAAANKVREARLERMGVSLERYRDASLTERRRMVDVAEKRLANSTDPNDLHNYRAARKDTEGELKGAGHEYSAAHSNRLKVSQEVEALRGKLTMGTAEEKAYAARILPELQSEYDSAAKEESMAKERLDNARSDWKAFGGKGDIPVITRRGKVGPAKVDFSKMTDAELKAWGIAHASR